MKKTYLQPATKLVTIGTTTFICDSKGVTSSSFDITYGGADENSEKDPASRQLRDIWEEE